MDKEQIDMDTVYEIRKELWSLVSNLDPDTGVRVQELVTAGNKILLQRAGKTEDDLGHCAMCVEPLSWTNVARDECTLLRLASNDKLWCNVCADGHDDIDWDEYA